MPNSSSHMSRIYPGEGRGLRIATWLNNNQSTEYGVLVAAWRGVLLNPGTAGLMKRGRLSVGGKTIKTPIPELLERYLRLESEAMLKLARRAKFDPRSKSYSFTYEEAEGVCTPLHSMFALFRERLLDRVKVCRRCREWFYRRFRHQEFCSMQCQQAYYRSDPAWKARRAKWARDNRALHATKNVK